MSEESVTCFNCGKKVTTHMKDGSPTWYGSYQNDKLIQAVCAECHAKGVRTEIGKNIDRQMGSK